MSWYQIEVVDRRTYRLHIKWWHPAFWVEGFRALRESGGGFFESVCLTFVLITQIARKKS